MLCDVTLLLPPPPRAPNTDAGVGQGQVDLEAAQTSSSRCVAAEKYHMYSGLRVSQEVHAVMRGTQNSKLYFFTEYAVVDWASRSDSVSLFSMLYRYHRGVPSYFVV